MRLKRFLKVIIFNTLILIVIALASTTYAYWSSGASSASKSNNVIINIGYWILGGEPIPNDPDDPYTDPIELDEPLEEVPEGVEEFSPSEVYEDGDVVYYEGMLYVFVEGVTSQYGKPTDSWANYHTYSSFIPTYREYVADEIVIYEVAGVKYLFRASGYNNYLSNLDSIITTNGWHPYYKYVYDYIPSKNYQGFEGYPSPINTGIVKYNGKFYQYNWANQVPGAGGGWTELSVAYNSSTNYNVGNLVTVGGNIYQVVNAARANMYSPSAHEKDAWNLIYGDEYRSFNTYNAGDVVSYNGVYFQAVAGGTYNENYPGEVINSWNRVDTYYYKSINTYKIGDKVIYNGIMYIAVENITLVTKKPGSSDAWIPA